MGIFDHEMGFRNPESTLRRLSNPANVTLVVPQRNCHGALRPFLHPTTSRGGKLTGDWVREFGANLRSSSSDLRASILELHA
jgi:hypothetical protein